MDWSLPIGRIAGTDIRLHVTFLMFLAWIGIADYLAEGPSAALESIVFILLAFLCVTLHEVGHISAARHFGVRTPQVVLSSTGGNAGIRHPAASTTGDVTVDGKTPLPRTERADAAARMRSRAPPRKRRPLRWAQRGA